MSAPSENSPNEFYIEYTRVILSRLKPDAKVSDLAPHLQHALDILMQALGGANLAANAAQDAEGARLFHVAQVTGPNLDKLALKVAAHFDSKTAPAYLAIFAKTPSVMTNAPLRDQPGLLAGVAAALGAPDTPKDVKALAKEWLAAHGEYVKALAVVAQTDAGLVSARKVTQAARTGLLVAYAKLRGELMARFPRQPEVIKSIYPRQAKKAKKAKKEAVVTSEPSSEP